MVDWWIADSHSVLYCVQTSLYSTKYNVFTHLGVTSLPDRMSWDNSSRQHARALKHSHSKIPARQNRNLSPNPGCFSALRHSFTSCSQGRDLSDLADLADEKTEEEPLLVHPNVPSSTSEALGVPTLMSRVLEAEELDFRSVSSGQIVRNVCNKCEN